MLDANLIFMVLYNLEAKATKRDMQTMSKGTFRRVYPHCIPHIIQVSQ